MSGQQGAQVPTNNQPAKEFISVRNSWVESRIADIRADIQRYEASPPTMARRAAIRIARLREQLWVRWYDRKIAEWLAKF